MADKIKFSTIPSYPEFEVSRCGKVRKKVNGRLHTPCMGKYYMVVGERVGMSHRLVGKVYRGDVYFWP